MPEYSIFHRPRYEFLQLASLIPNDGYRRTSMPSRSSPPKRHPSIERGSSGRTVRPREDYAGEARRGNDVHQHQHRKVRPEGYSRRHPYSKNEEGYEDGGEEHRSRVYTRGDRHPTAHDERQDHRGRKSHNPETRDSQYHESDGDARRFHSKEKSSSHGYRYRRE